MSFLIFLIIVLYLFYLLFLKPSYKTKKTRREGSPSPGVKRLVKDPVCGVYIQEDMAVKLYYKGQTYYFCSKECRDEFLKSH